MSFVDLMRDDIWSDADITNRTENIIRSYISRDEETILNRKVTGMMLGQYTLTADEAAQLQTFAAKTLDARVQGTEASADNELLKKVLQYESNYRKHQDLAQIPLSDDSDIASAQIAQLESIQEELSATSQEVLDLAALRGRCVNPVDVPTT